MIKIWKSLNLANGRCINEMNQIIIFFIPYPQTQTQLNEVYTTIISETPSSSNNDNDDPRLTVDEWLNGTKEEKEFEKETF